MTSTVIMVLIVMVGTALSAPSIPMSPKMAAYSGYLARPERLTLMKQPLPSAQYHAQDELGQYTYGYTSADGQAKAEIKGIDGSIAGKYSYIDAHGKRVEVSYVADKDGFRAVGDHIPKGVPPLPEELAKAYDEANERLAIAHSQVKEKEEAKEEEKKKAKGSEEEEEEEEEAEEGGGGEDEGGEEGKGKEDEKKAEVKAQPQVAPPAAFPLHQQQFIFGMTSDGRYAVAPVTFAMAGGQKLAPQVHGAYIAAGVPQQKFIQVAHPYPQFQLQQQQQAFIPQQYHPKSHTG